MDETTQGMQVLSDMFKGRDWFFDIGLDIYGRYVVYVHYMNHETLHHVPDKIAGRQVLVHFATSKTARKEQFTSSGNEEHTPFDLVSFKEAATKAQANGIDTSVGQMLDELLDVTDFVEEDIDDLIKELDRLERICGSNCLQDIFYEVHDGKNAVTNLSAKFPDVRRSMEKLYAEYGFDVIYEEMDG